MSDQSLIKNPNCTTCVNFKSFREDFFGDEMEPDDQGFCLNGDSPYHFNEGAGYDVVCGLHKTSDEYHERTIKD